MSKEIYSEGRVVGSSAYEIYLKQHMALFPDPDDPDNVPPASERQWLAASLAMGSSLLLKIPQDSNSGKQTTSIPLPANSRLVAGNIIYGSLFLGDATFDTDGWATKITAYRGVENTSSSSPITGNTPPVGNNTLDATATQRIKNYMKFHDWSITFDSDWELSGISAPYKDLKPNFSYGVGKSYLNVTYDGPLDSDVYVLLTGFTSRSILAGTVGDDGSVNTDRPEDGDFLGPEVFPWTAPVILIVPVEAVAAGTIQGATTYERKFPATASTVSVDSDPVIDFKHTVPADMFDSTHHPNSIKEVDVTDIDVADDNTSASVLMAYSYDKTNKKPAALYGGLVTGAGTASFAPLDIHAPNTVKLFTTTAEAIDYEQNVPYNYSLYRDSNNVINQISNGQVVPVAKVSHNADGNSVDTTVGNETIHALSMGSSAGTLYNLNGSGYITRKLEKYSYTYVSTQPADWATNYGAYYIRTDSGYSPNDYSDWAIASSYGVYDRTSSSTAYYADFTWKDLVNMLHNNKRLRISHVPVKYDPNSAIYYDLGPVFVNMFQSAGKPLLTALRCGSHYVPVKFGVWGTVGGNTYSYAPSGVDGYFRVILRIDISEYCSVAAITLRFLFFLDSNIEVRVNSSDIAPYFHAPYIAWRGPTSAFSWASGQSNWLPMMGTDAPGQQGELGTASVFRWTNVPENVYSRITGKTITFDNNANSWGVNLSIAKYNLSDDPDVAVITDRSYSYTTQAGLDSGLGTSGNDTAHAWYKGGSDGKSASLAEVFDGPELNPSTIDNTFGHSFAYDIAGVMEDITVR